ncbi:MULTISPECIES: hypothetical protein [Streptomyces]|uniref:hypothetical protein n=1 Tax=Streptomyces TaxID=1883 RepID=UPI0033A01DB1
MSGDRAARVVQQGDAGGEAFTDRLALRCEALGDGPDDLQANFFADLCLRASFFDQTDGDAQR